MKGVLFLIFLFSVSRCDQKDEHVDAFPTGTWKLVAQKVSIGGPAVWSDVTDGEEYLFTADGKWTNKNLTPCSHGRYLISEKEIHLSFGCEKGQDDMVYSYELKGVVLTITPKSILCSEECLYRFQKK